MSPSFATVTSANSLENASFKRIVYVQFGPHCACWLVVPLPLLFSSFLFVLLTKRNLPPLFPPLTSLHHTRLHLHKAPQSPQTGEGGRDHFLREGEKMAQNRNEYSGKSYTPPRAPVPYILHGPILLEICGQYDLRTYNKTTLHFCTAEYH